MKRIRIKEGMVALVFRKGNYRTVLTSGTYWVSLFDYVIEYDLTKAFTTDKELNMLLKDTQLAALLEVVEVKDNEIAVQYENGNFKGILSAGQYAFWKGLIDYKFVKADLSDVNISDMFSKDLLVRRELQLFTRVFVVESYEQGLLMVNGVFERKVDQGIYYFWKNATAISVLKADMRLVQMEVSGQEILTRDKAALRVNFFGQYRVTDIVKTLIENKDSAKQLYVLMQLALREFIGRYTLDELLEDRTSIAAYVKEVLNTKADDLGIEVRDCGVKDIILSGDVKDIMNQVLIAQKQAQANVIARREETAATRSLLNTAKLMEDNEMLFRLKEMEYVEKIAEKVSSTSLSGGSKVVDQLKEVFTGFK